jgi:2-polyprenyl-6-hydroxyphenyl methylase / 3-demethylubiquinone-9 3-methyltransferase
LLSPAAARRRRWGSVEDVADQGGFLHACATLVALGGGMVLATMNRTVRAFALGIVAAEYVLGWLPRGTHRWSRFVRPSEAARPLRRAGLRIEDFSGVVYDPLRDRFALSRDLAVNYMLFATRT